MSLMERSAPAAARDWISRLPGIMFSVASTAILLAKLVAVMIGGSVVSGKIVDGHYFLGARDGSILEVSRALYSLSLILAWSVQLTLAILVVAVILACSRWVSRKIGSLKSRQENPSGRRCDRGD